MFGLDNNWGMQFAGQELQIIIILDFHFLVPVEITEEYNFGMLPLKQLRCLLIQMATSALAH